MILIAHVHSTISQETKLLLICFEFLDVFVHKHHLKK